MKSFIPLKKKFKKYLKMGKMTKYGVPEYEDLKTSTRTVMVYTNISFDLKKIFESVKVTDIEAPLTKKKKNVDKKRLVARSSCLDVNGLGTTQELR